MKKSYVKKQQLNSFQQELSATYCADEKLYTSTFADLFPQFKDMVMTGSTQVDYQQTRSDDGMLPNPVINASIREIPTYVSDDTCVRKLYFLVKPPQTNEDYYFATGGIIYSPLHSNR
jgi:hypothetical protein